MPDHQQPPLVPTGWESRDDAIHRTIHFEDYRDAVAFTVRVALEAEAANHHPDLLLAWGRVDVSLTSHDAGGVTDRDVALATRIDRLATAFPTASRA